MAYQLVFRSPAGEQTITLDRPIVVGRDPGCDVPIDSVRVSRRHAEFAPSTSGVQVRDLGSRNGVFVNGTRIEQATLGLTDRVLLGDVAVTLGSAVSPTLAPPAPAPYAAPQPSFPLPPTAPGSFASTPEFPAPPPAYPAPPPGYNAAPPAYPAAPPSYPPAPPVYQPQPSAMPAAPDAGDKTTVLPRPAMTAAPGAPGAARPAPASPSTAGAPDTASKSLTAKLTKKASLPARIMIAVLAASVITFLATAVPLSIAHSQMVTREAMGRAATVVRSLGAENGTALATGQSLAVTVQTALLEAGVKEAYIIGPDGRVLAPTEKLDERFTRLDVLGDLASLQGLQTAATAKDVQAAVVIESGGRRLGVAWVRLDPSFTSAGSPVALYLAASLLTSLALAFGIGMALRKVIMSRLATFATDVDLAAGGQLDVVTESLGMPRLAESVNFVLGRMRMAASPAYVPEVARAPMPGPDMPAGAPPPPPVGDGLLTLDAAYLVTEANPSAAHLLQVPADRLVGRHVLEAVSDQGLVTAIITIMGDLTPETPRAQQVPGSPSTPPLLVEARQASPGAPIQITLRRVG